MPPSQKYETFTERTLPEGRPDARGLTDLTVVVALKNDRLFLEEHVHSILSQENVRLQVIFADAESTDGTAEHLTQLIRQEERCELQTIQVKNIADLRNRMLPSVRSPYVWFIEGCNSIPPGSCDFLLEQCRRFDADIVAFSTTIGRWGAGQLPSFVCDENRLLTMEDKVRFFSQVHGCFSPPTGRVYKTSFLRSHENLLFVTDNAFEGCIHNWCSTILADRVLVLPKYSYHQSESSKLSPWRILGWRHHAEIMAAFEAVRSFLRQSPKRARFLKPLEEVATLSCPGHIFELAKGLDQMRIQVVQKIEDARQIVMLPDFTSRSDSAHKACEVEMLFQEGLDFHRQGNLPQATASCRQVLSRNPLHTDAWHLWSVTALADQDYPAALGRIRHAISLCDTNPVYCNHCGLVLKLLGCSQEAKEMFEKALTLNPNDADTWSNLGQIMLTLNQDQRNIENAFRQAIALAPQHPDAHYHLGIILHFQKKHQEALVHFEQAITYCTTNAIYFYTYAVALKKEGRFDEALALQETAIRIDPNVWEARWQIAMLLHQLERPLEQVEQAINDLLRLQPEHSGAIALLEEIRRKQRYREEFIKLTTSIDVVTQSPLIDESKNIAETSILAASVPPRLPDNQNRERPIREFDHRFVSNETKKHSPIILKSPGIQQLAQKYSWPDHKPNVPEDLHGWCGAAQRKMFKQLVKTEMSVILELGAWLGMSARLLLSMAPHAVVICVDHWLGTQEHHEDEQWCKKLPTLYETFLVNLWEERNRVIPVRFTTVMALEQIHQRQIVPDLIYIDAAHTYKEVYADVTTSLRLFPTSVICGDDWSWDEVRQAVTQIAKEHHKSIALSDQQCWWFES